MKSYLYTYSEKVPRTGACQKTVNIYRIVRNRPVFVTAMTDTYVSEFQLVMQAMEKAKELPRRAFDRHANGSPMYGCSYQLKDAGIAFIERL